LHPYSSGKFSAAKSWKEIEEQNLLLPCTPLGVITLLKKYKVEIAGKNAVVVGRSNLVGKPIALMLLANDATVTIAHSRTKNLKEVCAQADILIAAIGKPKFITKDFIKPGAVVIDVGVNRLAQGLCGDVDFEDASKNAGLITPVPGGVGQMTIAMLMKNTVSASQKKIKLNNTK
jgi:methylenetetrahydrofolate dehydrogenase (NADP+)/methenyltetrahydrofolate cyclohydrolase